MVDDRALTPLIVTALPARKGRGAATRIRSAGSVIVSGSAVAADFSMAPLRVQSPGAALHVFRSASPVLSTAKVSAPAGAAATRRTKAVRRAIRGMPPAEHRGPGRTIGKRP